VALAIALRPAFTSRAVTLLAREKGNVFVEGIEVSLLLTCRAGTDDTVSPYLACLPLGINDHEDSGIRFADEPKTGFTVDGPGGSF